MTIDIDDFFLLSTLPRSEYLRISVAILPDDIREEFLLDQYIHNDYVLFEVTKGMYGLPQAGYLAQKELVQHLAKFDYHPAASDPCLFRHKTNGVAFTLVVDDFLVKYKDRKDATHLLSALQSRYLQLNISVLIFPSISADGQFHYLYLGIYPKCYGVSTLTVLD